MLKNRPVVQCMTAPAVTIEPHTRLLEAMQLLVEHEIRRLPVVQAGRLVGIVTYGDFRDARPSSLKMIEKWAAEYFDMGMPVERIMTRNPISVYSDATVGDVAALMRDKKVSGIPVIDREEHVIGLITESDLFSLIIDEW